MFPIGGESFTYNNPSAPYDGYIEVDDIEFNAKNRRFPRSKNIFVIL